MKLNEWIKVLKSPGYWGNPDVQKAIKIMEAQAEALRQIKHKSKPFTSAFHLAEDAQTEVEKVINEQA